MYSAEDSQIIFENFTKFFFEEKEFFSFLKRPKFILVWLFAYIKNTLISIFKY